MNLKAFRDKVRYYRRLTGQSQQALAEAVGLYPTVLSAKLNNSDNAHLTHPEIKRIIQTLAEWEAISEQAQVQELLKLVNLNLSVFTSEEWHSVPLNRLETLSPVVTQADKLQVSGVRYQVSGITRYPIPDTRYPIQEQTSVSDALASTFATNFLDAQKITRPPTNLPAQLTSFVGRNEETEAVYTIFKNPDVRLLTLTGPGGTGKTRLALHFAAILYEKYDFFSDGIFFVALAPITDPTLVISAIAQVFGLKDGDEKALTQTLVNYLRDRQLLVVLDNFEQVLEAGTAIAELLEGAARVKFLVTSRSLLQLYGEHEYPVPPLTLPPTSAYSSVIQRLEEYSAVQLFVQRAKAVRPDFSLTKENVQAVTEICVRLDGLPLAIELAAARCRMLTPQAMLPQLTKRLALVTGGPRNLPQRQQTLRSTIEWSYNLLTEQEQQLFAKLGVFVGSFSVDAAEKICGEGASLLEVIIALTEKNLLKQIETPEDEPRFSMLETIREYAWEQLQKGGIANEIQQAHLTYFLELVEQIEPKLHSSEQMRWANLLERKHDNLRAALQFALEQAKAEDAGRLGLGLHWFWYIHSHVSEGRRWLEKILNLGVEPSVLLHAGLLRAAGQQAQMQGDYAHAIPLQEQSIELYRQTEDSLNLALALRVRGTSALYTSDYPKANLLLEEALGLFRKLNYNWGISMTLISLGQIAREQGHYKAARQLLCEALEQAQIQGDNAVIGHAELGLGFLELALGNYEQVQILADSGLKRAQALGDQNLIAWCLWNKAGASLGQGFYVAAYTFAAQSYNIWLSIDDKVGLALALTRQGAITATQGEFSEAANFYTQALELWHTQQCYLFCAICLEGLALVATEQGQLKQAVHLFSRAAQLREQLGTPLTPSESPVYQKYVAKIREELGEQTWNTIWTEGAEL
jgi:predicted ATPase/transcriptional regulator with XRE-family HTH domain